MKLIVWFAKNPIAANLLMLLIIVGGLLTLPTIDKYLYPPAARDQLEIEIRYPGAGPSDIERSLCIPIEEAIFELEGIKHIDSNAQQEVCKVHVQIEKNVEAKSVLAAMKARIDAIETLPNAAENIRIRELYTGIFAIIVAVSGDVDTLTLQRIGSELQAALAQHPDIGKIVKYPQRPYELSIEVPERALRRYQLSFEQIAFAIRESSLNNPAGEIKTENGKFLIRGQGQALSSKEFAEIEIRSEHNGSRLLLGDIANISESLTEQDWLVRMDGKPAVEIIVSTKHQIPKTVNAVHQVINEFKSQLPQGVKVTTWDDWSKYYQQRISLLMENALSGFILVFLVLILFLQFRLALWVSSGIVVSFLGALFLLPLLGLSINIYSLAAFILVLGIVVDDTIVIGENIYTHQQKGDSGLAGAISGSKEVASLVVLMVLSTIIAFMPGFFLPGLSGRLMSNVSAVVILVLLFSLLEALFILPAHLASESKPDNSQTSRFQMLMQAQGLVNSGLQWFIHRVFLPVLHHLLSYRYLSLAGFITVLLLTLALVVSGRLPSVMQAEVNDYYLVAHLKYPPGTPFDVVHKQVLRLEQIAQQLRTELNQQLSPESEDSIQHVFSISYDNWGMVNIELSLNEQVRLQMDDLKKQWQERFGEIPVGASLLFQTFWPDNLGLPSSTSAKAIELILTAPDTAQQQAAGEIVKARLAGYTGVHSISSSMQSGKPELRLKLKSAAKFYGLTMQMLSQQVRNSFYGLEVQRYIKDRDEYKVMLRYPAEQRQSLENLQYMPIRLKNGATVPFSVVAETEYVPGFAEINRHNRQRILTIGAEIHKSQSNAEAILKDLKTTLIPELQQQFPGLQIRPGRVRQEQGQAMTMLWRYGILALLAIYTLLAIPLRSYLQPLIIMLSIPFGFVGAALGHLLLGLSLTLESYIAMFAVAGVVVNDSLVLVSFINNNKQQNLSIIRIVKDGCSARFRPILLTTLTTFFGLLPILSEQGPDAEKIIPMATTLAFGVLFSTLVTLLLVPVCYVILNDIKKHIIESGQYLLSLIKDIPDS